MKILAKPIILLATVLLSVTPAKALESYTRTLAPDGTVIWIYDSSIKNSPDFVEYYVRYCDKKDGYVIAKLKYDKRNNLLGIVTKSPNNVKLADIEDISKYVEKDTKFEPINNDSMLKNTNQKVLDILNVKPIIVEEKKQPQSMDEWLNCFRAQIKENWKPNKNVDGHLSTVLEFYVTQKGLIEYPKILESSGNAEYDKYALDVLQKGQPYSKLPKDEERVLVGFTFALNDYNKMDANTVYRDWWKDFQNQVQKNWNPTKTSKTQNEYKTVVSFNISDKGEVENYKISESSGSIEFDNYAMQTLLAGQPYKPMPKISNEIIPIKFTFTFNQNNSNDVHTYFTEEIVDKIAKKWKPKNIGDNIQKQEITMKIVVSSNGKVKSCAVLKTSGNHDNDAKAVNAVYKAAPFRKVDEKYLDYGRNETSGVITIIK